MTKQTLSRRAGLLAIAISLAIGFGCDVPGGVEGHPVENASDRRSPPPASDTAERSFEITYRALVDGIPPGADWVRIWLPYPTGDENQEVEVTEISAPVAFEVLEEPEFGNRMLYLELNDPGSGDAEITMIARVLRKEVLRTGLERAAYSSGAPDDPEVSKWLEPDELVPSHDERIQELSAEVTADAETDLEKARAIYDYVVENMTYSKAGTGWGRGDIYWACDAKTGNCTDFHALFTGLARAAGIPAKFAIGFPVPPERGEGRIGGYHCWSEFHLDGYGWVPVDASEAAKDPSRKDYFFGGHDENRVEFTKGRDIVLQPSQAGDPLNYFVYPYVEIDGEPHDLVRHEFTYRDLPVEGRSNAGKGGGKVAGP